MHSILLDTADLPSRSAKVRGANLPQEFTLSQFISHIETSEDSWGSHTPACEWSFVVCNSEKQVTDLRWGISFFKGRHPTLKGEFLWKYLPDTLLDFDARRHLLKGPVELPLLPPHLQDCRLSSNAFTGTLDLTQLPSTLWRLYLDRNKFVGKIDVSRLPTSIQYINLSHNKLCGKVELVKLPKSLLEFDISFNLLSVPSFMSGVIKSGGQNVS
mmetsp:Transcript_10374/g.13908  ORF Transcript_10374/g.13908 Transcript_10374/m.13908 type:complete len:214 (-) Transcript_10374:151-792(-)